LTSNACRTDNFDENIVERAKKLLNNIENATGKSIAGRDGNEVVNAFGTKLL